MITWIILYAMGIAFIVLILHFARERTAHPANIGTQHLIASEPSNTGRTASNDDCANHCHN